VIEMLRREYRLTAEEIACLVVSADKSLLRRSPE
jgi:hypothetical protein